MEDDRTLRERIDKAVRRMRKARDEQPTLLAQTIYLGTVGLMFILPVVAGAYLGRWLDQAQLGYSFSWTVSLIVVGVFVGAMNVYLLIRE